MSIYHNFIEKFKSLLLFSFKVHILKNKLYIHKIVLDLKISKFGSEWTFSAQLCQPCIRLQLECPKQRSCSLPGANQTLKRRAGWSGIRLALEHHIHLAQAHFTFLTSFEHSFPSITLLLGFKTSPIYNQLFIVFQIKLDKLETQNHCSIFPYFSKISFPCELSCY